MIYTITTNKVNESQRGIRGFATVTFGDSFKITNIAIMENKETGQLFVSMPRYKSAQKDENDKDVYVDICHPISKEFREQLYGDILKVFNGEKLEEIPIIEEPAFSVSVSAKEDGNILGYARVYFGEDFIVGNITVVKGQNGPFVSMPSYKTKEMDDNNKPIYRDICYPVTKEFRERLYNTILETYQMEKEKRLESVTSKSEKQREEEQKQEEAKKEEPEQKPAKSRKTAKK